MSSLSLPAIPARERTRALSIALCNKAIEVAVLSKVRGWRGEPSKFDRWALAAIHALMLAQLGRMRRAHAMLEQDVKAGRRERTGLHNSHVTLCAPDLAWQAVADDEAIALRNVLTADLEVHHIGSTAIERLAAKPIVDLAIALPSDRFDAEFAVVRWKLKALGYRYLGVRGGHFFEKASASVRTHALQVHPSDSPILTELLRFRDALRQDDILRNDYETVKRTLAAFFPQRRLFYVFYKSHWIDDWQWRHSGVADWACWFLGQKKAHARLASGVRQVGCRRDAIRPCADGSRFQSDGTSTS
ncbi:GrpB family protein [Oleiharenicola sp. Vm1]|uniref:GrpB family protein n=1 Tax=Oleiharenicola sp. Vm1 TaxID=3398393 RepID=UPI0039F57ADF